MDMGFCFCNLLRKLDIALSEGFLLPFGARFLPAILVQRRNVDYVAITMLNLGSDRNLPYRWGELWNRVQPVCISSNIIYD